MRILEGKPIKKTIKNAAENAGEVLEKTAGTAEKAKAGFSARHDGLILSCRVYVKPQDRAACYVINDIADKIGL